MGVPHTDRPAQCTLTEAGSPLPVDLAGQDPPVIGTPSPRYRVHGELVLPEASLVSALVERDRLTPASMTFLANDEQGSLALCVALPARFESSNLGIKTARITRLLAWGPNAAAMLERSLQGTVTSLAGQEFRLVLASCDDADEPAARSLLDCGFAGTGTRLTYVYRRDPRSRPDLPRLTYRVRPARCGDLEQVMRLAGTVRGSQFHRIPGLDPSRIRRLYQEWARKALAGEFADGMLVAVRGDDPVAFLSWKGLDDVELATGRHVAGRGLGAADPDASGAYVCVAARALIVVSYEGEFEGGEFDIDSTNRTVVRIVQRFGLTPAHSTRTFHRLLQPPADDHS